MIWTILVVKVLQEEEHQQREQRQGAMNPKS